MSMNDLSKKLEKVLKKTTSQSTQIIQQLDEIIEEFGIRKVNSWRNLSNRTKNTLLHELVEKQYFDVVRHVILKYNLRTFFKRESDGATPLEIARSNQDWKMCDLLMEFGDDKTITDTYEQFASKKQKDKTMNIVWVDLEFTSFIQPKILECAVIITDKDLNEIQRNQWVVHFDETILSELGEWHQNAFKDVKDGGNGLFNDCITSTITKEQVEKELLDLLKRHCPSKACPLAGSSIHIDKEVLKVEMPDVHNYLHYRVIDVTSFREIMKRWAPGTSSKFVRQLASNGREVVNHRAMDDIEWSIEMMKMFKPLLTSRQFPKKDKDDSQSPSENSNIRKSKLPIIVSSIDRSKLQSDEKQLLKRIEFEETFDVRELQLSSTEQQIYDENPHLREVFVNNEQLIYSNNQDFTNENRKLIRPLLNRSLSGVTNVREVNTIEYWGQRKIILSQIEFLTNYGNKENCLVVYAGAAPGIHLNYLSSLFPQLNFILIDEKHFLINETEQIKIKSEKFTDKLAKKYSEKNEKILFICDIKTFTRQDKIDEDMINDMNDQMRWNNIMKPFASLLKFRLPRTPGTTEYLQGEILIDLWSSKRSFECRLIVEKGAKIIEYNQTDFERGFRHFHNVTRTMYYEHDFDHIQTEGLDHCYDCRAEIFILKNYFIQIKQINDEEQLRKVIAQLSYEISRNIYDKNRQQIINIIRTLNIILKQN